MNNRPSKRQRKEDPPSWLQNHSLACVASPEGQDPILTPVASSANKELFLSRLKKELIGPLQWARKKQMDSTKKVWKKRLFLGTNQCTRILERAAREKSGSATPALVVLARDVYPPTILSHIPVLAKQIKDGDGNELPILLLPGKASQELGDVFGTRRVSVMVFVEEEGEQEEEKDHQSVITSFVRFVKDTLLPDE